MTSNISKRFMQVQIYKPLLLSQNLSLSSEWKLALMVHLNYEMSSVSKLDGLLQIIYTLWLLTQHDMLILVQCKCVYVLFIFVLCVFVIYFLSLDCPCGPRFVCSYLLFCTELWFYVGLFKCFIIKRWTGHHIVIYVKLCYFQVQIVAASCSTSCIFMNDWRLEQRQTSDLCFSRHLLKTELGSFFSEYLQVKHFLHNVLWLFRSIHWRAASLIYTQDYCWLFTEPAAHQRDGHPPGQNKVLWRYGWIYRVFYSGRPWGPSSFCSFVIHTGQKLLDSLAETWDFFFCNVLSMLQAIFHPIQVRNHLTIFFFNFHLSFAHYFFFFSNWRLLIVVAVFRVCRVRSPPSGSWLCFTSGTPSSWA